MERLTLEELQRLLKSHNRTDLSRRLGLCRTSIAKVISGERRPSKHLLAKLGLRATTVYEVIPREEQNRES